MRRRYLISYDVSCDKRRYRIFKTLLDRGDHVQYSVFFCDLNRRELAELRGLLIEHMHAREDQIIVLDLGSMEQDLFQTLECLGKVYQPMTRIQVI